jgi:hypothetical protein
MGFNVLEHQRLAVLADRGSLWSSIRVMSRSPVAEGIPVPAGVVAG